MIAGSSFLRPIFRIFRFVYDVFKRKKKIFDHFFLPSSFFGLILPPVKFNWSTTSQKHCWRQLLVNCCIHTYDHTVFSAHNNVTTEILKTSKKADYFSILTAENPWEILR